MNGKNDTRIEFELELDFEDFVKIMRYLDDIEDFFALVLGIQGFYEFVCKTGRGAENILFRYYGSPRSPMIFVRKLFVYSSQQLNFITLNRYFSNLREILYIPYLEIETPENLTIGCSSVSDKCPNSKIAKIEMLSLNSVSICHIPSLTSIILKKSSDPMFRDYDTSSCELVGIPRLSSLVVRGKWKFEKNTNLGVFRESLVEIDLEMESLCGDEKYHFFEYPNLTYLCLSIRYNQLDYIKTCKKLRFLELVNTGGGNTVSLEDLPSIHSIVLRGNCGDVKFDKSVHRIRRLKVLGSTNVQFNIDDCPFLNDLEYLNTTRKELCPDLLFGEVGMITSLKYLGIHVRRRKEFVVRVYDMPNLTHLKISSCSTPKLRNLPALKNLTLVYLPEPSELLLHQVSTSSSPSKESYYYYQNVRSKYDLVNDIEEEQEEQEEQEEEIIDELLPLPGSPMSKLEKSLRIQTSGGGNRNRKSPFMNNMMNNSSFKSSVGSIHSSSYEYRSSGILDQVNTLRRRKENEKLNRLIKSFGEKLEILSIHFSNRTDMLLDLGEEMKKLRVIFIGSYSRNFDQFDPALPYDLSRYFEERYKYSPISMDLAIKRQKQQKQPRYSPINKRRSSMGFQLHHQQQEVEDSYNYNNIYSPTKTDNNNVNSSYYSDFLPSVSLKDLPELKTLQIIQRIGCLLLRNLDVRSLTFDQLFKVNIDQTCPHIQTLNLVLAKQWMFKMIRTTNVRKLSLQLSEINRIDKDNFPKLEHLILLKYVIVKNIRSLPKLRKLEVFQSSFENISDLNITKLVIDFSNPNPEPYEIDFSNFGKKVKSLVFVDSAESGLDRARICYQNLDVDSFPNLRKLEIHTMAERTHSMIRNFKHLETVKIIRPSLKITRVVLDNLPSLRLVFVTSRMNQDIEVEVKRSNPKVKIISK